MKGAAQLAIYLMLIMSTEALAAKNPAKVSAKCRQTIAKAVSTLAKAGLKDTEKCHKLRNKGKNGSQDCNTITQGATTAWGRAETLQSGKIGSKCKPGEEVLGNYASTEFPEGNPTGLIFPAARNLLEESSRDAQGSPAFTGEKKVVKSLGKCHAAIGKARTAIVLDILSGAQRCQKKVDKKLGSFAGIGIDPSCIVGPGKKGNKAVKKMNKKCKNFDGAAVGTCAGFPDCLIAGATRTGQALAAFAYGGATSCGNSVLELGENCDDGAESATCNSDCTAPRCGDAVVNASAGEECDLGEGGATGNRPDGECNERCLNAICGDGIVVAGVEECDDGNAIGGDGCTECIIDGTICGAGGLVATIVLDTGPDGQGFAQFGSATLETTYPGPLSLPGSGFAQIFDRFTDRTGISGLFLLAKNDTVASSLRVSIAVATAGGLPRGELQVSDVRFDCTPGAEVKPGDFTCQVTELTDPQSNELQDIVDEAFKRCFVSELVLP